MGISVRRTAAEEAETLWLIQRRAFAPDLEKYNDRDTNPANESLDRLCLKIARCLYFTILDGETIVGGADVRQKDEFHFRLNRIYIDPDCQNRGIGTEAIRLIETQFPSAQEWDLDTPHLSFRNHHLYEKLGYEKVGQIEQTESLTLFLYEKKMKSGA